MTHADALRITHALQLLDTTVLALLFVAAFALGLAIVTIALSLSRRS